MNKIDLIASDLDKTKKQIEDVIGIDTENAVLERLRWDRRNFRTNYPSASSQGESKQDLKYTC